MAKDYKALMAERRATGGVPQIDPDDVVTLPPRKMPVKVVEPQAQLPSATASDPRRMEANPTEPKAFNAFRLPAIRARQIKYEAADKSIREWEVVDRALDLYFKTHYPQQGNGEVEPLTGGKHGNKETA